MNIYDVPRPRDIATLSISHAYYKKREKAEFWEELNNFVNILLNNPHVIKNENDKKVLLAVKNIVEAPEEIEILNKKAIYLYLRELTGLNTKQIANTLKKIRIEYAVFVKKWNEGKF